MEFEDLQNQWQKEGGDAKVSVSYDVLLKEIKRGKSYFDAMVFWRDVREIGVGIVLIILFLVVGMSHDAWPYIILSGCILFVCLFLIIDKIRNKKNRLMDGTLKDCVKNSLAEVNHQIWLLRNVFWWYLLPFLLGFLVTGIWMEFYINRGVGASLGEPKSMQSSILDFLVGLWFPAVLFIGVYWLNRWAVKSELLPRKKELEDLLGNINNGGVSEPSANPKSIRPVVFLSLLISLVFSVSLIFISRTSLVKEPPAVIEITPPLTPEEDAGLKELVILSARYGAKDQWVEVTQNIANSVVCGNMIFVISCNALAGRDPLEGCPKMLEIKCLWDGRERTVRVPEGLAFKKNIDAGDTKTERPDPQNEKQ